MMTLDDIMPLIDNRSVTTEDFNSFISTIRESLPKSTIERSHLRLVRPKKVGPVDTSVSGVEHGLKHKGDTSPLRTRRGRNAVKDRGEYNKKHASEFSEEVEFLLSNRDVEPDKIVIANVDESKLLRLVVRLLREDVLDRDWLYSLKGVIECHLKS